MNLHVKSDDYAYRFTEVPGVSLRPFYNAYGQMDSMTATIEADLDSLSLEEERFEGTKKSHLSNYFERNSKLRADAVRIHGITCMACGFDFSEVYGHRGEGYIEVHHALPVSELGCRYSPLGGKSLSDASANPGFGSGRRGGLSRDVYISQEADEGEGAEFLMELPVGSDEIAVYRFG